MRLYRRPGSCEKLKQWGVYLQRSLNAIPEEDGGAGHPVRFFEIEHSTTAYSGLLRFNDVMIDFPITEAFIVGDGDKTQRKFEREIARRTFEHSGLVAVSRFLLYEQVRQTWLLYRTVGSGSKAWGASGSSQATEFSA